MMLAFRQYHTCYQVKALLLVNKYRVFVSVVGIQLDYHRMTNADDLWKDIRFILERHLRYMAGRQAQE